MSGPKNSRHRVRRSAIGRVEDELGRGDDAVGALLLQPGHAAQRLVGDVLPQALLADLAARELDARTSAPAPSRHLEGDHVVGQDLAQLVVDPAHGPVVPARHGHAERQQVVDGRCPTGRSPCRRRSRRCCRRWCRPRRWSGRWRRPGRAGSAYSMASSVMTPASSSQDLRRSTVRPSSSRNARSDTPRMRFSFSVLTITQSGVSGTAPPVSPVPAPRGMAWSPRSRDGGEQRRHLRLLGRASPPRAAGAGASRWRRWRGRPA